MRDPGPAPPPLILPDGTPIPIHWRISPRASRLALRVRPDARIELVVPSPASIPRALAFLATRQLWLAGQVAKLPPAIGFAPGAILPILGVPHLLVATGPGQGRQKMFRLIENRIEVTGAPEHLARRTRQGLANHALAVLTAKTRALAARVNRVPGRISIGDAKTRWGSCASSGNIKFSWRLILAPETVLDYVVAHEVAHLIEMNHGDRFWTLVETLAPGHATARDWLKRHGASLLRYGVS